MFIIEMFFHKARKMDHDAAAQVGQMAAKKSKHFLFPKQTTNQYFDF